MSDLQYYDPIAPKYIVKRADGKPLHDNEPVFVIRATDVLASSVVRHYLEEAVKINLPYDFQRQIMAHLGNIQTWQAVNRDKVKIPD